MRGSLACLTDDVEWEIPGRFHVRGKEEFDKHIVDEGFVDNPAITATRLTEGDDVVVAEGTVRTQRGAVAVWAHGNALFMTGGKYSTEKRGETVFAYYNDVWRMRPVTDSRTQP